jgi:hypothetical protein
MLGVDESQTSSPKTEIREHSEASQIKKKQK